MKLEGEVDEKAQMLCKTLSKLTEDKVLGKTWWKQDRCLTWGLKGENYFSYKIALDLWVVTGGTSPGKIMGPVLAGHCSKVRTVHALSASASPQDTSSSHCFWSWASHCAKPPDASMALGLTELSTRHHGPRVPRLRSALSCFSSESGQLGLLLTASSASLHNVIPSFPFWLDRTTVPSLGNRVLLEHNPSRYMTAFWERFNNQDQPRVLSSVGSRK